MQNCFTIKQYPDFKMGMVIDTNRMPFNVLPLNSTDESFKEHLIHNNGFMCLGFDEGISTLVFTVDKTTGKLSGIIAMWTIIEEPKSVFNRLKSTYLPCIPIEALTGNPNSVITDDSHGVLESYKYAQLQGGVQGLHYWVGLKY